MNKNLPTNRAWLSQHSGLVTLILISFLALGLRLVFLEKLPATFLIDEILSGYLGRYLWTNGVDLYGNPWPPLYFNRFGDFYIILPMYLDGLATFLFGLTRFATRFPTALLGALAVFPTYAIGQRLTKHSAPALLAAFLLAILPWHLVLSRATAESVIELTVIASAAWALLKSGEKQSGRWLALATVLTLLSYLIYHTARVFNPLLWLGYLVLFWPKLRVRPKFLLSQIALVTLFCALTLTINQTEWGRGRFAQTSIFAEQSGVSIRQTEMIYNLGRDNVFLARLFHNKVLSYGREFVNQYLTYFSPQFLFGELGWKNTRYAVPEAGLLYLSFILMLLINFWPRPPTQSTPIATKGRLDFRFLLFLLWWLMIAPLPSALTVIESPNIRRTVLMTLPLVIFAGVGWWRAFSFRWRRVNLGQLLAFLIAAEFILFAYLYLKQSDLKSSLFRSDGLPELAAYLAENPRQAERLVVTGADDLPLYYLFATHNLSPTLAEQFGFNLRIKQIDGVMPTEYRCLVDLPESLLATLPKNTLFFQPETCDTASSEDEIKSTPWIQQLVEVEQIFGVNPLIYFRVFQLKQ